MRYDVRYPYAPKWFEDNEANIAKCYADNEPAKPCANCGRLTRWVDLSFEAPLCSDECSGKMWEEYWIAERKAFFKERGMRNPLPLT